MTYKVIHITGIACFYGRNTVSLCINNNGFTLMARFYLDISGHDLTKYGVFDDDAVVIPYKTSNFPAGEIYFSLLSDSMPDMKGQTVVLILNSGKSDDIMRLMMANDAIRRYSDVKSIELFMPYVPYGRQDRVVNGGESLSIKVFAQLINSMKFDKVIITDPHSSVTSALLDNCVIDNEGLESFINDVLFWIGINIKHDARITASDVTIVAPDAGAEKRASFWANRYGYKLATATKHRVNGNVEITMNTQDIGERVVIIDDICDGGRTFTELAKVLRGTYGVKHITLIVTHGIFSAGMGVFDGLIGDVKCYNDISANPKFEHVLNSSQKFFGR